MKKLKNKLTHNLGLKIMAVLFAAILWMISMDINDPVAERSYSNVQVQLVNTGSLTARNKTYTVLDNTDVVQVRIKAPSSVRDDITRENITAKADFTKMTDDYRVPIEVSIEDSSLDSRIESITTNKDYVVLEIEDRISEQLSLEVIQNGTLPAGYATGRVSTETNTISISGPESAIAPVKRAVVEVSLDDVTSDINMQTQIKLLDADGNEISNSNIKKSIEAVKVTVPILRTKEVAVAYQVTGTPEDGYALTGTVTCTPSTVVIAGKESALADITQIEIPASELDVTDATESVTKVVDITKYFPSSISLGDSAFNGNVTLTAEIEPIRRKTIAITESTIQRLNVPDGWLAEFVPDQNLRVTLRGLQRYLDDVDEAVLTPHADVSTLVDADGNVTPGEQEIVVNFLVPANVQQEGTVRATIRLTRIAEE